MGFSFRLPAARETKSRLVAVQLVSQMLSPTYLPLINTPTSEDSEEFRGITTGTTRFYHGCSGAAWISPNQTLINLLMLSLETNTMFGSKTANGRRETLLQVQLERRCLPFA